jgi:hypothetical protein
LRTKFPDSLGFFHLERKIKGGAAIDLAISIFLPSKRFIVFVGAAPCVCPFSRLPVRQRLYHQKRLKKSSFFQKLIHSFSKSKNFYFSCAKFEIFISVDF